MKNFSLLVSTLYWSVLQTHYWHWQCKKHSLHILLGDYYDEVQESLDDIVEVYSGISGELPKATKIMNLVDFKDEAQVKAHFETICKLLTKTIDGLPSKATHLQGDIDSLRSKIAIKKYLLNLI